MMSGDVSVNCGNHETSRREDDGWKSVSYDREREEKHFSRIVRAFHNYGPCHSRRLDEKEKHFQSLPGHHKKLLHKFSLHLAEARKCIDHNAEFIDEMIMGAERMFLNEDGYQYDDEEPIKPLDMDKVDSVLVQFVRDWSEAGAVERDASYGPILRALEEEFSYVPVEQRHTLDILVPGAGLGRLAYEIYRLGFSSQGNEYSMFMLIASNYILNLFQGETNSKRIYPFAARFCNNVAAENQVRPVLIPDIRTCCLHPEANFSMVAGEFIDIYRSQGPNAWDCVATCFFLDTANNVLDYVETIYEILKPGGIWINLGPLLYHYADAKAELSIEPPYDLLKECIIKFGFEFEKETLGMETPYASDRTSMAVNQYKSVFFLCRKPRDASSQ